MKAVVQRVSHASVAIGENTVGKIGKGLLILVGIEPDDALADVAYRSKKCLNLRIFEDIEGKMNLSVCDVCGELLIVSQFTLLGDARKGNRPSFIGAAPPEVAIPLYEELLAALSSEIHVETGVFGADMKVSLLNDGPVTILLDSKRLY